MKPHDELKVLVMCYWRFNRGCPIVAMEYPYQDADVLTVNPSGRVIETEVKISVRELKRDRRKPKHLLMSENDASVLAHYFYFAVPAEIQNAAESIIKERFPYAGLLAVRHDEGYGERGLISPPVDVLRNAQQFNNKPPLTPEHILDIARGLSATACRLAYQTMIYERKIRR